MRGVAGMAKGEVAKFRAGRKRWRWKREVALGEEGSEERGRWRGGTGVARGGWQYHQHDTLSSIWLSHVTLRPDIPGTVISFP